MISSGKYDLLNLYLLLLLCILSDYPLLIRCMRQLFQAFLTNKDRGALVHALLKLILRVLPQLIVTATSLCLEVVLEMLLEGGCCHVVVVQL